ncbi:EamA/RhaT family transporter [Streptomyces sp. NPDC092296]|uniref:EamA/RhaT family transporter n=1 Tax=Streptomyces sp. NPDC092296 TaxID=3366012 RepID=UPI003829D2C9
MTDDLAPARSDAPRPEPIRFFGTSWVVRGPGYRARRVAVAVGALLAAVAGALVMRLAVSGVLISGTGSFVNVLLVLAVLVCSCLAGVRTWKVLAEGRDSLTGWMADDKALGPIRIVGFVGMLVAYFVRSLLEAPGEGVARTRHEAALKRHRPTKRPTRRRR